MQDQLGVGRADAVVADRDDRAAHVLAAELGEHVHRPEDREAVQFRPRAARVGVDEADRCVNAGLPEDLQHDPTMPAGPDDDYVHAKSHPSLSDEPRVRL